MSPSRSLACLAGLLVLFSASCRTAGPHEAAEAYARALREGRVDDAYALTSSEYRANVSRDSFGRRYANEMARFERATAILSALERLKAVSPEIEAVREPDGWRVAEVAPVEGPKEALARFLDAAEAGDFEAAWRMLAGEWRARYTPARLAKDFADEPLAKDRLARARAALEGEWAWRGDEVELDLGEGKAVRLRREGGAFKVVSLE